MSQSTVLDNLKYSSNRQTAKEVNETLRGVEVQTFGSKPLPPPPPAAGGSSGGQGSAGAVVVPPATGAVGAAGDFASLPVPPMEQSKSLLPDSDQLTKYAIMFAATLFILLPPVQKLLCSCTNDNQIAVIGIQAVFVLLAFVAVSFLFGRGQTRVSV